MTVAITLRPVLDSSLQVKESPVSQPPTVNTEYDLTTTEIGSSPTSPVVTAINKTTRETVTATVVNGSATAALDVITFNIHVLSLRYQYEIAIQFTIGNTVYIRYLIIQCEDSR